MVMDHCQMMANIGSIAMTYPNMPFIKLCIAPANRMIYHTPPSIRSAPRADTWGWFRLVHETVNPSV
jgi:hypothetical protein